MSDEFYKELKKILLEIFAVKQNFFKSKYSTAGIGKKEIEAISTNPNFFTKIPPLTLKELAKTPFKQRRLRESSGFNKLIYSEEANRYFLLHRTIKEITESAFPQENFSRPLVLMNNVYEAIEGCLYFYNCGILPLIGEVSNPSVIYVTAKQYMADALYIDHVSIENFRDELLKLKIPLHVVTIVDRQVILTDLKWPKNIKINYVISLPEFGFIAYACEKSLSTKKLLFHAYPDVYIEPGKFSILTSVGFHACPMIRYKSSLSFQETDSICDCDLPSYVLENNYGSLSE